MKIILVNYRYFISGGPERYMFNVMELLKNNGHEVIPFSVAHNSNVDSAYKDYFCSAIGTGEDIYGHEYKNNIKTIVKVCFRMLYSFEAKKKLKKLIKDVQPDIVYVLQFQNKLSCSVIDAAYESNIPVVQRISDFAHICIDNIFYHYQTQKVCELCLNGSKINAIRKKCANDSYINSILKVLALKVQDIRRTTKKINSFIIPSLFTTSKFIEFGIPENKIHYIPTFFNNPNNSLSGISYGDYFIYVGRVDPDKGLFTLIKAFVNTPYKLIIIGFSMEGYDLILKDYLKDKKHNIVFTGKLDFSEIIPYLQSCLCMICPSEWYDNFPNSVLESYAYEKAVLASNIGSLKDMVVENETGLHFETGNPQSLINCVEYIYNHKEEAVRMGKNSYKKLLSEYSSQLHYSRLIHAFEETIAQSQPHLK